MCPCMDVRLNAFSFESKAFPKVKSVNGRVKASAYKRLPKLQKSSRPSRMICFPLQSLFPMLYNNPTVQLLIPNPFIVTKYVKNM
ncbi:Uncharacterized protein TCM_019977 [Theobroma cacao]|uniref:Uncharacterized protein n=1 Tax=Theobroma cacao TaxID=3641 RepID=A0A061EIX0_THECC|nr:Uncharacterized protein TCM_019977 [Theobroma cacao]